MNEKEGFGDASAQDFRDAETVLNTLTTRRSGPTLEEQALTLAAAELRVGRTRTEYTRDVRQYLVHCELHGEALAEGLESWKAQLKADGQSVASVNRKLSGVKSVLRAAADKGSPELRREIENAVRTVKGIRQVRSSVRAEKMLTPAEVEKVLAVLSDRGKGFVNFLYATGCGISEALGIRLTDCHANGGVTIEVTGKGSKARQVRVSQALFDQLRSTFNGTIWLFETSKGNPYPRTYVTDMIGRASKRALGRRVSAHGLRHAFATSMIAKTGKLEAVSEYLGHADPAVTMRFYTHQSLTDADLGVKG
jgi:integrase